MVFSKTSFQTDRAPKRVRTEVTKILSNSQIFCAQQTFANFSVISSLEGEIALTSKSVVKLARSLEFIFGRNYKAKKLSPGDILVEVYTQDQRDSRLNQTNMWDLKVAVLAHRILNT